jgi:hypothetical protein
LEVGHRPNYFSRINYQDDPSNSLVHGPHGLAYA